MSAPNNPPTPNDVAKLLIDLGRQLQQLDASLSELEEDYTTKAENHNVVSNQAFLKERAKGSPQYVCKAVAETEAADAHLAMAIAQTKVRAQKRKIEILRERIGIGRTVASSLRAELELERVPNQYRR